MLSRPILESKGMRATFQKKCKRAKNCLKKGKNVQICKYFEKGQVSKDFARKDPDCPFRTSFFNRSVVSRLQGYCKETVHF